MTKTLLFKFSSSHSLSSDSRMLCFILGYSGISQNRSSNVTRNIKYSMLPSPAASDFAGDVFPGKVRVLHIVALSVTAGKTIARRYSHVKTC